MSKWNTYGKQRAENKRLIQQHLDNAALDGPMLAAKAGVTRQSVSATINGHIHSEKVLQALRDNGVPEELLFDPRKQQQTA